MNQPSEQAIRKACDEAGVRYVDELANLYDAVTCVVLIALARRIEAEAVRERLREYAPLIGAPYKDVVIPKRPADMHASDCAIYNEPAMPAGPCDCGKK